MSSPAPAAPSITPRRLRIIVLVFALLGPVCGGIAFVIFFGTFGMLAMGPLAIFAGLMYFIWWLPWMYLYLGAPFLLAGSLYALAVRRFARQSLLIAAAAGALAFAVFIGGIYLYQDGFEARVSVFGPDMLNDARGVVLLMLLGVVPSWWLSLDRSLPWHLA